MALSVLALAACGDDAASPGAAPLPKLETVQVASAVDARGRSWDGVVEAVQEATLSAQTGGRVAAVEVDVNDPVKTGQLLLRLTAVEQQAGADSARAQLRAAEASATEAERNYRRYAELGSSQFVSKAQVDQARAARDSAVAARDAARAQLAEAGQQAGYTMVRAPFAGVVSRRDVEPGETVVPGQVLMAVHAPGALRIEVQVPQSEADAIRRDPRAQVVLGDGRRAEAATVVVFPAADPATHSVTVRVQLPTLTPAAAPGTTAKVVFPIASAGALPRIPASALVQRSEVSGVYVLDGQRLSLRQLRLGARVGDEIEVIAGLKSGERIATDPVAAVQALAAQRKVAERAHD